MCKLILDLPELNTLSSDLDLGIAPTYELEGAISPVLDQVPSPIKTTWTCSSGCREPDRTFNKGFSRARLVLQIPISQGGAFNEQFAHCRDADKPIRIILGNDLEFETR